MNKISSYIGFAIKSRKILIGQSKIKQNKEKQIYCIIICKTATENLRNLAKNVANKNNCCVIEIDNLQEITHLQDIKIRFSNNKL